MEQNTSKTFLKSLKKYFEKEDSVSLAFLFGSFAKGYPMKESDVDIAVYFKNYHPLKSPLSELKKPERIREKEREIFLETSRIVEREVNLICLNQAPASLISEIFETGIPLKVEDEKLYWELYLGNSLEAEDFFQFVDNFFQMKWGAKSLSSKAKEELQKRLDFLKEEIKELEEFKKLKLDEYRQEKIKRRNEEKKNIERWAENLINVLIDISKIVLASEKMEIPKSYGDALFYFGLKVGLKENEAEKLAEFAQLRNILAHEYLEVVYGRIKNFIKEFSKIYPQIYSFLEKYLK